MSSNSRIWNIIKTADLVAVGGDKTLPMKEINQDGDGNFILVFAGLDDGEDYTHTFDENCDVKVAGNTVTLTDDSGEEVELECFDYKPIMF